MSTADRPNLVYQLRVSLRGISPPIWRRLRVPGWCTIADLHFMLQTAMGWEDEHLHRFCIRGWHYGVSREGAMQWFAGPSSITLAEFHLREHERFTYEYNFYAGWLHDIRVEKIVEPDPGTALPACIAGARACPEEFMPDAEYFMDARDDHCPGSLIFRLQELIEEVEPDLDRLGEERRDWQYWGTIDQLDRKKINAGLQALRLSFTVVPLQESVDANHRQATHRKRGGKHVHRSHGGAVPSR